jgi:hypothetical protein
VLAALTNSSVISKNLMRRDLSDAERIEVSSVLIEVMKERAEERRAAAGGDKKSSQAKEIAAGKFARTDAPANVVPLRPALDPVHVKAELAKIAGISPRTAQDALTINLWAGVGSVNDVCECVLCLRIGRG